MAFNKSEHSKRRWLSHRDDEEWRERRRQIARDWRAKSGDKIREYNLHRRPPRNKNPDEN